MTNATTAMPNEMAKPIWVSRLLPTRPAALTAVAIVILGYRGGETYVNARWRQ